MTNRDYQTKIDELLTEAENKFYNDPPVCIEYQSDGFCMTCGEFSCQLPVKSWRDAYHYALGAINGRWLPESLRSQHRDQIDRRKHDDRQTEDYKRRRRDFVELLPTLEAILDEVAGTILDAEAALVTMSNDQQDIFAKRIYNLFEPLQEACVNFAWWQAETYPGDEAYDSFEYLHASDYKINYGVDEKSSWTELLGHIATLSIPNILTELANGELHKVAMRCYEITNCMENKRRYHTR